MTTPRQGVHTASELRRSTRRLDRCLAGVDQILGAMGRGEALHLRYENGCPLWSLSGGRRVVANDDDSSVSARDRHNNLRNPRRGKKR